MNGISDELTLSHIQIRAMSNAVYFTPPPKYVERKRGRRDIGYRYTNEE
jgi:hypothetical protein